VKLETYLSRARGRLPQQATSTPELDVTVLLEYITGKPREWLYARADEPLEHILDRSTKETFQALLKQRAAGVPVAYLTGEKAFYGLTFEVTSEVMIPRPESEALVAYTLETAPDNARVLDMGTGSGAIAVATQKTRPDLDVTASDISPQALAAARHNGRHHQAKIQLVNSDLFEEIDGWFDIIVANLPYLKPPIASSAEAAQEPSLALNGGGRDGLDIYRNFLARAADYVSSFGLLVVEAEPWQHPQLIAAGQQFGFRLRRQEQFMLALELDI
jgi:release factor glutamine methyltransferase